MWTELLQMDEIPFASYEDVAVGTEVMAPWQDGGKVQFSEATVVEETPTGEYVQLFGYICMVLHA